MAKRLKSTVHKMLWVMEREQIAANPDLHKVIRIGKQEHKRYSGPCLKRLHELFADQAVHDAYANRNAAKAPVNA